MMTKSRSADAGQRRDVLRTLTKVKRELALAYRWWDVRSTVYIDRADRAPGDNAYLRPREEHEYPENSAEYWAALAGSATAMIHDLALVRDQARRRHHELVSHASGRADR